MLWRTASVGLIAGLLVVFPPCLAVAQSVNFSVSPAEVRISDLGPGRVAELQVTIYNSGELARNFTFTTFQPPKERRRQGRDGFPEASWIRFSHPEIEVPANSQANVTVTVAIPPLHKWSNQDWEIWLGVAPESSDVLGVELWVRLLVSTGAGGLNVGLVAGIVTAAVLLISGACFYYRSGHKRRAK